MKGGRVTTMKVSEYLAKRDSHTAYGQDVLNDLVELCGLDIGVDETLVVIRGSQRNGFIKGTTGEEFYNEAQSPKDPKGPISAAETIVKEPLIFGGWELAAALSYALTGKHPEAFGRGFAFREAIRNLQEAGL
jgi:hypothetical protein